VTADPPSQPQPVWRLSEDRIITLDRPRLIGILNVTPDSFSDGGRWIDPQTAAAHAIDLLNQGADMIDVGGESTRPGAVRISADEQIRRVVPVILAIRTRSDIPISIDTTLAAVAQAALGAGANAINDVAAGAEDPAILDVAVHRQCGLTLMHRLTQPGNDAYSDQHRQKPDYGGDVVAAVKRFLSERVEAAIATGVSPQTIVVDPGLGFGKNVSQNYELVRRIAEFTDLGAPVLCAASRKSFVAAADSAASKPAEPNQRIAGSVAIAIECFRRGVRLFRVHDVAEHRQALAVAAAIDGDRPSS
jgi:dihydropteroate synthase